MHAVNRIGPSVLAVGLGVCWLLTRMLCQAAPELPVAGPATVAPETITEPDQAWALASDQKRIAHPLRIEGRVGYVDPRWRNLWIEKNGVGNYILLSSNPPRLRQGQHVRIEGTIIPVKGLDAAAVTVTVLQEYEPVGPLDIAGKVSDVTAFNYRHVTAQAYVDAQQMTDDDHVHLFMIIDDQPVTGGRSPTIPTPFQNGPATSFGSTVFTRGCSIRRRPSSPLRFLRPTRRTSPS